MLARLVLSLAALAVVVPAQAQEVQVIQGGPGGRFGPFGQNAEPPVDSHQLRRFADLLRLDADQREAAAALLEGMQTEWDAIARKTRDEVDAIREEFQGDRDPAVFAERMPEIMRRQREARARLEQSFMADFKALLTDAQQADWPLVERAHRRESTITQGRFSGESVDLVRLVESLNLPEPASAAVRPILSQYEADLDRALIERNDLVDRAMQRVAAAGPGAIERAMQDEEFKALREKARKARLNVRDINNRYARQIASTLPPDQAAKFDQEFIRRSFPQVFRDRFAADSLAAAAALSDLTPEQRKAIEAMREAYSLELDRANRAWIDAVRKFEETDEGYSAALAGGFNFRMRFGEGRDDDGDNPVARARRDRRELDRKTLENLRGVLNDDQRSRLPQRRERRRGGPAGAEAAAGPGDAVFVAADTDDFEANSGEEGAIRIVRQVTVGPEGEPVESTSVFVSRPGQERQPRQTPKPE